MFIFLPFDAITSILDSLVTCMAAVTNTIISFAPFILGSIGLFVLLRFIISLCFKRKEDK